MHIEEHNHCFIHYFGVKTLSETLFSPPLKKPGYGARSLRQLAMARPETDSDRVSYAFPPLAVLAGFGLARAAAELVLRCEKRRARPIRPAGAALLES